MADTNPDPGHFWPLPLPLGCWASDPDGQYRGHVVAVFATYREALKWGNWDLTHTAPGECCDEPYYLIHTPRGSVLIGSRFARPGLDRPPKVSPVAIRALTGKLTRDAEGR